MLAWKASDSRTPAHRLSRDGQHRELWLQQSVLCSFEIIIYTFRRWFCRSVDADIAISITKHSSAYTETHWFQSVVSGNNSRYWRQQTAIRTSDYTAHRSPCNRAKCIDLLKSNDRPSSTATHAGRAVGLVCSLIGWKYRTESAVVSRDVVAKRVGSRTGLSTDHYCDFTSPKVAVSTAVSLNLADVVCQQQLTFCIQRQRCIHQRRHCWYRSDFSGHFRMIQCLSDLAGRAANEGIRD